MLARKRSGAICQSSARCVSWRMLPNMALPIFRPRSNGFARQTSAPVNACCSCSQRYGSRLNHSEGALNVPILGRRRRRRASGRLLLRSTRPRRTLRASCARVPCARTHRLRITRGNGSMDDAANFVCFCLVIVPLGGAEPAIRDQPAGLDRLLWSGSGPDASLGQQGVAS